MCQAPNQSDPHDPASVSPTINLDDGPIFNHGEEAGDRLHDGDNRLITNSEGFSNLVAGCLKAAQEAHAGTMQIVETVSD